MPMNVGEMISSKRFEFRWISSSNIIFHVSTDLVSLWIGFAIRLTSSLSHTLKKEGNENLSHESY